VAVPMPVPLVCAPARKLVSDTHQRSVRAHNCFCQASVVPTLR